MYVYSVRYIRILSTDPHRQAFFFYSVDLCIKLRRSSFDIITEQEKALEEYTEDRFEGGKETSYSVKDGYISLAFDSEAMSKFSKSDYKAVVKSLENGDIKIKNANDVKLKDLKLKNVKLKEK